MVLFCFSMSAPVGLLWWCPIVLVPGHLAMILRLSLRSGLLRGRDSLLLLPVAPRSLLVDPAYLERFAFILQGMWDPCRTPVPVIRLLGPLKVPVPLGVPLHRTPGVIRVRSSLLVDLAFLEKFAFLLQGMWDPCRTPLPLIRPPGVPLHKAPGGIRVRSNLLTFPFLWWNISLQKEIFLLL